MEKIVINVTGQTDLDSTIKKLVELGVIDEKNAKQFEANNKKQQALIDQLKNRVKALEDSAKKAGDETEESFKKPIGVINTLRANIQKLTDARDKSNNPKLLDLYNKKLDDANAKLKAMTSTTKAVDIAPKIDNNIQKLSLFDKALTNITPVLAGAFAVSNIIGLGKQILDITSKFQKFEAVLTNTLGSRGAAQQAMSMILDFAAKTPFAVDEITQSYIKLVNQGFRPTMAEMTKLGDLASSQGKSLDQLTEAIIDAQTGEFERLKEFGIRAKKEGDKVTFTFKEQDTTVKATASSIRQYILGLGDAVGVAGSMAAISKTLEGQLSNLGDSFDQILLAIGKEGAGGFSAIIGLVNDALGELGNALQDKPSLFDSIKEAVLGLINPVKELFTSIWDLYSNLLDLVGIGEHTNIIMKGLGIAIKAIAIPVKVAIEGVIVFVHSLQTLLKAGQNVYNFFQNKPLQDIGLDKLKNDFNNIAKILTFTDGQFKHASDNIVDNVDKQTKAIEKEVRSIKVLEEELKDLIKTRDEMDISNKKELSSLNAQIKAKQELIKELKGESEAYKNFLKMKERGLAADLNLEIKTEIEKKDKKLKLKEIENKENKKLIEAALKRDYDAALKEVENRKKAEQLYTDFVINSILKISDAIAENNRIRTENELHRLDEETNAQIKAIEDRNKAGLISDEAAAAQKEALQKKQAQKELELRRKQAQKDKEIALFQIAINTAAGVLKTIATLGPPVPPNLAGIAGVATTLATGALEAAIVASQPLPQFKDGGYTGDGNVNDTAGIVHKKEFVMPADKTAKYKEELQQMYEGRYKKDYREPIKLERSLTDIRQENMADSIYKSIMLNGQFDDKNIVNAISKNAKVKLANGRELANQIANKIADRTGEGRLYA